MGTLRSNGKKFDSSRDRGKPFVFSIGQGEVIKGWDQGVIKMSLGEKARLHISADFGYGARGAGKDIPPNSDLVFEVELLAIGNQYTPQCTHTYTHVVIDAGGKKAGANEAKSDKANPLAAYQSLKDEDKDKDGTLLLVNYLHCLC